jgi:hypothetical protein
VVSQEAFQAGTQPGQAIMVGSADEIVEKIQLARQVLGIDRFIGQIDWGGLAPELVEESITRYATEIAPALRSAG